MHSAKLYHAKCLTQAAFKCNSFLEKALVKRVNQRNCMRIVRFCLSICVVEIRLGFGFPVTGVWPSVEKAKQIAQEIANRLLRGAIVSWGKDSDPPKV
jgi:hypothetical protein